MTTYIKSSEEQTQFEEKESKLKRLMRTRYGIVLHSVTSEQESQVIEGIKIQVTPFYNHQGPAIAVGELSKELRESDKSTITELATKMKEKWDSLSVASMYVLSIRLFDLGHKEESVYWYYAAQYRGRLLESLMDPSSLKRGIGSRAFELRQAHRSFQSLLVTEINGYALSDLDALKKTIKKVRGENKKLPHFHIIYPKLTLIDSKEWNAKNEMISDGLQKMAQYIESNADTIKKRLEEFDKDK